MLDYSLWNSLLQLVKSFHCHASRPARMPSVELLGPLLSRDRHLLSVDLQPENKKKVSPLDNPKDCHNVLANLQISPS